MRIRPSHSSRCTTRSGRPGPPAIRAYGRATTARVLGQSRSSGSRSAERGSLGSAGSRSTDRWSLGSAAPRSAERGSGTSSCAGTRAASRWMTTAARSSPRNSRAGLSASARLARPISTSRSERLGLDCSRRVARSRRSPPRLTRPAPGPVARIAASGCRAVQDCFRYSPGSVAFSLWSTVRNPRTTTSNCSTVPCRATPIRSSTSSGSPGWAIRLIARSCEYDNRPADISSASRGYSSSDLATRT